VKGVNLKIRISENSVWIAFLLFVLIFSMGLIRTSSGFESSTAIHSSGSIITRTMIIGVNMYSGTPSDQFYARDVPLLNDIGIKYIRIGTNVNDINVNMMVNNGISVLGTFAPTGWPDPVAFGDYVYNKVSKFAGRVEGWVVLNEANTNYFGFSGDVVEYTSLLKIAYTRAKEADPNIKIITTNALALEGPSSGIAFLQGIYANGGKGYFDIVGIDPYCYPESPLEPNVDRWGHSFWNLPTLRDVMVANGDGDKPVWIVEFGYRTPSSNYPVDHWSTCTEADQATFLVQALELAKTWPWLERFYIYEWMDSGDVQLGYWGLIREGYSSPYDVKPAFNAVKEFVE